MTSLLPIALSGLQAARSGLQAHAHNIANLSTPGFRHQLPSTTTAPQGGVVPQLQAASPPGADLAADAVGLIQARQAFGANLAVLKTGDQLLGTLIDLRA